MSEHDDIAAGTAAATVRVLLVDDDAGFRASLAERLELRGFDVAQAGTGEEGVRLLRADRDVEVVVLDRRLPDDDGKHVLREMKAFRPEVPVVMLTGYGSVGSARRAGELGAFRYLTKPTPVDDLAGILRDAARERMNALARQDMPAVKHRSWRSRLLGAQNLRPAVIVAGVLLVVAAAVCPPPEGLLDLLSRGRADAATPVSEDPLAGYPAYRELEPGGTIAAHYQAEHRPPGVPAGTDAAPHTARRAMLMIAVILTAALFWATNAVPIGITAIVVAVAMYAGGVMRPDNIAQAFAKDSVVFIFGVLVFTRVIMRTGLNHRIAMLLLKPVRTPALLLFVFLPLFALTCSFISESILIALMMPLFVDLHRRIVARRRAEGGEGEWRDQRQLLVLFALMLCYASNVGGPGSPAAGGRNAVMIGILSDYGRAPTFLDWMTYGLPFVPVAALAVGAYFYVVFRRHLAGTDLNAAGLAQRASDRLGPLTRDEKVTAAVMLLVVGLWLFGGERVGMGGPILLGLVVLNVAGVLKWPEIAKIHWDVVFLYGGASAIGKGLADTGGALYLARMFVGALPPGLIDGAAFGGALGAMGLPMAVSLLTGVVTNIMSDGATVAAIGPIAVPMAQAAGVHPWAVGLATAFASSFPHMLIIGTPANALAYIMCKDPETGRQLVTQGDFLRHGAPVFVLSFLVLWIWTFLGYWRWIGFGN